MSADQPTDNKTVNSLKSSIAEEVSAMRNALHTALGSASILIGHIPNALTISHHIKQALRSLPKRQEIDNDAILLNSLIGRRVIGWLYGGREGVPTIVIEFDDHRSIGFTATPEYHSYDQDRCVVVIGVEEINDAE